MDFNELKNQVNQIKSKLKVEELQSELVSLKKQSEDPSIWSDPSKASKIMQSISEIEKTVSEVASIENEINDIIPYSDYEDFVEETKKIYFDLKKRIDELELKTYLSGKYDKCGCFLSIHSGQGGTEAMDWASMLHRMYMRYLERQGWKFDILDFLPGEEAGIKSVSIKIEVPYAYGYLKGENGVHRLVRLSPFNADQLRQTSFSKVEVSPIIDSAVDMKIRPEDLDFSAFRAGGHGGQNVNKVSTAVRITHKPSGITVSCQSQRSQDQNRLIAMEMLTSKLWAIENEKLAAEKKEIKGENVIAGWGHQIRSYVLHPYKMVKDLRTRYETSDTAGVLDGKLEEFINLELKTL